MVRGVCRGMSEGGGRMVETNTTWLLGYVVEVVVAAKSGEETVL